jgi:hypothetical protein
VSLRLEERQYERLRVMSFEKRRPMAELVRDAVDEYLEERPIEPGQEWFWSAAWQEAEKEAEADLAAGRYETFDTMEEFLAGLE